MPINAGIALQTEGVQIQPLSQSLESGMRMRDLLDQRKIRGMQISQEQTKQKDLEIMTAAYQESQGDPDKFLAIAAQRGASPQSLVPFQKLIQEQRDKEADNARLDETLRATKNRDYATEMNTTAQRMETERRNRGLDERTAAAATETARHNKALEDQADANNRRLRNQAGVTEMNQQAAAMRAEIPNTETELVYEAAGRDPAKALRLLSDQKAKASGPTPAELRRDVKADEKARAKQEEDLRQAEAEKRSALQRAEGEYTATKDSDMDAGAKLRKAKRDIQFAYEKAVIAAGGRVTNTWNPDQAAGKGKLTDPATAQQYLQKAGGDKQKARQLAISDGWSL